jgi:hypothetical protein
MVRGLLRNFFARRNINVFNYITLITPFRSPKGTETGAGEWTGKKYERVCE